MWTVGLTERIKLRFLIYPARVDGPRQTSIGLLKGCRVQLLNRGARTFSLKNKKRKKVKDKKNMCIAINTWTRGIWMIWNLSSSVQIDIERVSAANE